MGVTDHKLPIGPHIFPMIFTHDAIYHQAIRHEQWSLISNLFVTMWFDPDKIEVSLTNLRLTYYPRYILLEMNFALRNPFSQNKTMIHIHVYIYMPL